MLPLLKLNIELIQSPSFSIGERVLRVRCRLKRRRIEVAVTHIRVNEERGQIEVRLDLRQRDPRYVDTLGAAVPTHTDFAKHLRSAAVR